MNEVVVDTNVWCMAHFPKEQFTSEDELDCADTCLELLVDLRDSWRKLVVDDDWKILGEYWKYLYQRSSPAQEILVGLQQTGRTIEVSIDFDESGMAILPPDAGLADFDPEDRKFVSVALARDPHPPIVNATDSDWKQHAQAFDALGIYIEELCPDVLKNV